MSLRVTLEDIARETGVSLATVSLVLRDKPGITSDTRQRVLAVAQSLGYSKPIQARRGKPQQLQRVGMLNKDRADDHVQTSQFYAPVASGIEEACRREHIDLLYAAIPVDAGNHPTELPRMLLEDDLDGLLLVGAFVDTTVARLMQRRTLPTVLVDAYANNNVYDSVVSDNFRGAYEAVSYLIDHGHDQIGIVGGSPDAYPSIKERRRGYLQALQDHGIRQQYFADSQIPPVEAAVAATTLLQRFPHITALFCCNDRMAIAVMQAAQALGRYVPDDLSIIGFDNIDLAEHVTPGLTTMHVDKLSMGRLAVQQLGYRARFPGATCMTAVLRPTLVERKSVRRVDVRL